jgi:hypothetical protein
MEEDKTYWLNKWGERSWYSKKDMGITATRSYYWVDRVIFIEESEVILCEPSAYIPYEHYSTSGRHSKGETTYTKFKLGEDEWEPIKDFDEYTLQLKFEYECRRYNI